MVDFVPIRGLLTLPFIFLLAASCTKNAPDKDIVPPITAPLYRKVIGYGVVNTNYTHVLDRLGAEGKSLGFLRKGSIVEVLERRPIVREDSTENWVLAGGSYRGWLREDELKIYETEAKAKTAAASLPK
ncbi:MAG: hypothetical protein LBD20_09905 [Spirochaetaceae bacterium]|jgi:hypothetical protein|nr:hypothetical protein [Spirochaetaceae bacterium]